MAGEMGLPSNLRRVRETMARQLRERQDRQAYSALGIPAAGYSTLSRDPYADIMRVRDAYFSRREEKLEAMEACAQDLLACLGEPDASIEDAMVYTWEDPDNLHGFAFPVYKGERVGPGRTWEGMARRTSPSS